MYSRITDGGVAGKAADQVDRSALTAVLARFAHGHFRL